MLQITSAKVTASPGITGWVQIHAFSPSDLEKAKKRGQIFVVIASKKSSEGIETISFEREIAGRIREEYYNSSQEKTFDALRSAMQKISDEFNIGDSGLEVACSSFVDGIVYSSAFGGGRVLIDRDGTLASILESGKEVITASGFPKENDIIVIGTKSFFEKISLYTLKEGILEKTPEMVAERLIADIYEGTEAGSAGAAIMKFEKTYDLAKDVEAAPIEPALAKPPLPSFQPQLNVENKLSNFFKNFVKRLPRRNIYIKNGFQDEAVSQSRKLTLSVGIILLLILVISIGFGIRQKKINDQKKEYQGLFLQASDDVTKAISLSSVNPDESRQLFLDGEQKLSQIHALKIKDPKIDELQKKIEDSRAAVLGEYTTTPDLFMDLGLLSSGFKGEVISSSGGNIYVLDKKGARVVSITLDTKKSKIVAGPSTLDNPIDLASYDTNVFVLFQDGIYLVGGSKTKVIDKGWSGDAFVYAFAGNLYVLDKSANAIYRYSGQAGNTFGSQQNWLSASAKTNFSDAMSWGMNGAVYVLYSNARILKYSLGSPQSFSLSGISPEIGRIDALYADPDNQYIYLLDKAGKRVVVIDKNGKYKAQYIDDKISDAISLVASEADKKIILLTGEKLLSVEMRHL